MRRLLAGDVGVGAGEVVELALVIKGLCCRPNVFQQADIFMRAPIARRVVSEIAVARLLDSAAAGDDVHSRAPASELIEGGELARRHGGGDKARPVRQQKLQPVGDGGGMGADQEAVGSGGKVADEHAVKPRRFVNARRFGDHLRVEGRTGWGYDLG